MPTTALKAAEAQLAALKAQEASLTDRLNTLHIQQRAEGAAAVALEFARLDLNRAEQYLDTIDRSLADLKFQLKSPIARIRKEFPAKPSPKRDEQPAQDHGGRAGRRCSSACSA